MQDGFKVYMDSYTALNGSCSHDHLDCFQKPSLRDRSNIKLGDRGIHNTRNRWFILFCHMRGPTH
jgi:hypothetical protein